MSVATIKVVCAWCYSYMGEKDGRGVEGISHSLCPDCMADFRKLRRNGPKLELVRREEEQGAAPAADSARPVARGSRTTAMQEALFALSQRQRRQGRAPLV